MAFRVGWPTKPGLNVKFGANTAADTFVSLSLFRARNQDERLIEVKSTYVGPLTLFSMSQNEVEFAKECLGAFRLFRVFDMANRPKILAVAPPLEQHFAMEAATWAVGFL